MTGPQQSTDRAHHAHIILIFILTFRNNISHCQEGVHAKTAQDTAAARPLVPTLVFQCLMFMTFIAASCFSVKMGFSSSSRAA